MTPSQFNNNKRNKVLFDFYSIVDYTLSVIMSEMSKGPSTIQDKLIQELHYLGTTTTTALKSWHMYGMGIDLLGFLKGYDDYEIKEEDILKHAVVTSMGSLLANCIDSKGLIKPAVLCKNESQAQFIKNMLPDATCIVEDRSQVNTSNYGRIVIGDINHSLEFKNPVTIDFMILNFYENFVNQSFTICPDILLAVGDVNTFTVASAYDIKPPVG